MTIVNLEQAGILGELAGWSSRFPIEIPESVLDRMRKAFAVPSPNKMTTSSTTPSSTDYPLSEAQREILSQLGCYWPRAWPERLPASVFVLLQEAFAVPAPAVEPKVNKSEGYATGPAAWNYGPAPTGVKLFLLTDGGSAITGFYDKKYGAVAWQYLFKRDREEEKRLGIKFIGQPE